MQVRASMSRKFKDFVEVDVGEYHKYNLYVLFHVSYDYFSSL